MSLEPIAAMKAIRTARNWLRGVSALTMMPQIASYEGRPCYRVQWQRKQALRPDGAVSQLCSM
jgi:hypothetical protein